MTLSPHHLIACQECDTLHQKIPLGASKWARCTQCQAVLYQYTPYSIETLLALAIGGIIVFMIANVFPIVELQTHGLSKNTTLVAAIQYIRTEGQYIVAGIIFFTTFLLPVLELAALIYILIPLIAMGRKITYFNSIVTLIQTARHWGMIEVLMLGILITLAKLWYSAHLIPGPGLFAFGVLTVLFAGLAAFDPKYLWQTAHHDANEC